AIGLVLLVLLVMCNSWFEPVIILVNIGIAVAVNIGTNVIFPDISEFTFSIVGIMQLVLSLDYSIILLNRYTQEKEKHADNPSAMKAAIAAAFPAVAGSSLTTFAGLLCLAFMGFRLGADMGYALAKGVLISLVCIFTVLPSLILMSDKLIVKTRKKALRIPMGKCSRFEYRGRFALLILLPVLLAGSYLLKNNTEILYMLQMNNPVDAAFEGICNRSRLDRRPADTCSGRLAEGQGWTDRGDQA
ncbi:MAG: MMPL family transporter, partial [Bacteroidales bacterium]|nr:MMPL family transporter [Bacteroidales bacterium]